MQIGLWQRVRDFFLVHRLTPFETSTSEGRSKERQRRARLTTISAVFAKALSILVTFVSIRLTVKYLGAARYGAWMTISSFITMLSFVDLGLGNGLINAIAQSLGEENKARAKRSISSTFFMLVGISSLLAIVFTTVFRWVPWGKIFNVPAGIDENEINWAVAILVYCFLFNLPLTIVQNVQTGYQEGFLNFLWQSAGNVLALLSVLVVIHFHGGLPWLVFASAGAPALVLLFNWIAQFLRVRPFLLPALRHVDFSEGRLLIGTGFMFFILQLMTLLGNTTDNFIISQALGVSAVTGYSAIFRLANALAISQFIIAPLWPAFGDAMARKDYQWARKTVSQTLKVTFVIGAITGLGLLIGGQFVVRHWIGQQFVPSLFLLGGFGCWLVTASYGGTVSVFLNSGSWLKKQVGFFTAASIISVVLKMLLVSFWAEAGVIWATVLAYGIFYLWPASILINKVFAELQKEAKMQTVPAE
jgi:O-antigen/teichoic acid export membrane protein